VILDRSPSMAAREPAAPDTKLATGRRQVAEALATLGATRNFLLVDPELPPVELADPAALVALPAAGSSAAATDLPRLLEAAHEFLRSSAAGASEVWICSDQRANDWAIDAPAWAGIRAAFARLPQPVRFQLVAFEAAAPANLGVRVADAAVVPVEGARQLALTIVLQRQEDAAAVTVPVSIEIEGVASVVEIALEGREAVLDGHLIPLEGTAAGWGRVAIPADSNDADNEFYFVFAAPVPRRTLVVSEAADAVAALALAAEIPPARGLEARVAAASPGDLDTAGLETAALLLWQAPLPTGRDRTVLESWVQRGGQVLFLPPARPEESADRSFAGVSWTAWRTHDPPAAPDTWRTDRDLLANTRSGAALPVGGLAVSRTCGLAGELVPLARLADGTDLLARPAGPPSPAGGSAAPQAGGAAAFLATTAAPADSTLATEGVVLYGVVQRAIDRGLPPLEGVRRVEAGAGAEALLDAYAPPRRVSPPARGGAPGAGWTAGVYAAGERLVAVNRPAAEDAAPIVADTLVDGLFSGLSFARIAGEAGGTARLVQEIWRGFLVAVILALIGEGLLCLPSGPPTAGSSAGSPRGFEVAA